MRSLFTVVLALLLAGAAHARPAPRYLIYVHGRIVQDQQSARPKHPEHGYYELAAIAEAFRKRGFIVTAEVRAKDTTVSQGADDVVRKVRGLLASGVAADHIIVVGASMGAGITLRAAARLQNSDVRFAVLGPCISINVPAIAEEEGKPLRGRLLAFREETDVPSAGCPGWGDTNDRASGLRAKEIVLNTGLRHGFLYRPLPEWVDLVAEWALTK